MQSQVLLPKVTVRVQDKVRVGLCVDMDRVKVKGASLRLGLLTDICLESGCYTNMASFADGWKMGLLVEDRVNNIV